MLVTGCPKRVILAFPSIVMSKLQVKENTGFRDMETASTLGRVPTTRLGAIMAQVSGFLVGASRASRGRSKAEYSVRRRDEKAGTVCQSNS
jgi:hypothetical protein